MTRRLLILGVVAWLALTACLYAVVIFYIWIGGSMSFMLPNRSDKMVPVFDTYRCALVIPPPHIQRIPKLTLVWMWELTGDLYGSGMSYPGWIIVDASDRLQQSERRMRNALAAMKE